ncbi:sulfatase-like hydrolase/transferase [Bradyrhizobium diazoefficiens]|uniref:sulfatase-like hydrolase/transferase n=1 Tax=Bradyrhizobium diazoefficiens TaxID=1355477 RepID=UPI00190A9104|nr:sulfatase-like hydrolase/transferase [Bradyrhizobium diazoefficiens]MBK3660859.1 sulfatase-like hydrolase/transferase [Bradyrhizobium diazoefficiens]
MSEEAETQIEKFQRSGHLDPMISIFIVVAAIAAIALTERSVEHLPLAVAALLFNAALLLMFLADVERAILLSGMLAVAIAGISSVKFNHSALKLTVSDLPLAFAGTVPFLVLQYPRMMLGVLAGSTLFAFASIGVLLYGAGSPIPIAFRIPLFVLALIGFAKAYASEGATPLRHSLTQGRCFYSTFVASLLDPASWRQFGGLALSDIANEPLPLREATPARSFCSPDIIVIQHESVFDPRIFGLPVEPAVEAFLSPSEGEYGRLNVDIFGGGSWQSEFSLLTGLSSASFGSSAYYLFKKGAGRFHSSLPRSLASLRYKTTLISSCRRGFLSYDKFYSSIGIDERIFVDELPPPFDVRRFEATNSDAMFLDAVIDAHIRRIADDPTPRFLYALTNFNHGPHHRRLVPSGQFERERAFAMASFPDAGYVEYYTRLAETASAWRKLRAKLANSFPGRPVLIVHYGDHQPVLTKQIDRQLKAPGDGRRPFGTFYAIEALNIPHFTPGKAADLDIAFLGTVALQRAGIALDPVFATRASLLDDCGEAYFASASERKRRFHRTLVDLGLIDLMPNVRPAR